MASTRLEFGEEMLFPVETPVQHDKTNFYLRKPSHPCAIVSSFESEQYVRDIYGAKYYNKPYQDLKCETYES